MEENTKINVEQFAKKQIHSLKMAGYLMMNGCNLIRMEQNQNNPRYNVFIFRDTYRVNELIDQWISSKQ